MFVVSRSNIAYLNKQEKLQKPAFGPLGRNLLNENNEFAIKTLALSIIQCYGVVNNQNPYHSKYNTYLNELKKASTYFEKYVDEKSLLLNNIKNDADIWQRALALPFYYA